MDFSNSLDLELQTDVKTVQFLPSAQDYIHQGLLLPSASPYQVKTPLSRFPRKQYRLRRVKWMSWSFMLFSSYFLQVDLCGIAEIVHMLLFGKNMKIIKYASYWRLAEECGPQDWQSTLDSRWQNLKFSRSGYFTLIRINLINCFSTVCIILSVLCITCLVFFILHFFTFSAASLVLCGKTFSTTFWIQRTTQQIWFCPT